MRCQPVLGMYIFSDRAITRTVVHCCTVDTFTLSLSRRSRKIHHSLDRVGSLVAYTEQGLEDETALKISENNEPLPEYTAPFRFAADF